MQEEKPLVRCLLRPYIDPTPLHCEMWPYGHEEGDKTYLFGNPEVISRMVLCGNCVNDMLQHLPIELTSPDPQPVVVEAEKLPDPVGRLSNVPIYTCGVCKEEFDTPQRLGIHKRKHR